MHTGHSQHWQCCLVTFIVTNVAPDIHCERDLQSKSVQIPIHASPELQSSQTDQASLVNDPLYTYTLDLILNLGLNAPSYLFFLFDVQGSCVPSLAVAVPVWHCSLEIESNWFWQAASDFNASKLLRGKILSVYLASYLEIWRLWGQLKHELILTNTYDLIIPGPGLTLAADTISVSAPGLSPVMSGSICIFTDLSLGHAQCPVQAAQFTAGK